MSGSPVQGLVEAFVQFLEFVLVSNWSQTRVGLALGGVVVLLYWSAERLLGEDEDPSVSYQASDQTGTMSMLLSGTKVVALVAAGIGLVALPEIRETPALGLLLVLVVMLHWIFEKEEREA